MLGTVDVGTRTGPRLTLRSAPASLVGFLALAATEGRFLSRDQVAFGLWPDRTERKARRALSDTIYRLGEAAGPLVDELLALSSSAVGLGPLVTVDLASFRAGCSSPHPAERASALDLVRGELLSGIDQSWADDARHAHQREMSGLLATVWDDRRRVGDRSGAVDIARRWIATDPYDESAHRALMRSLATAGDVAAASSHGQRFAERLADELGVGPSPETVELIGQLDAELEAAARTVAAPAPPALVGRVRERGRLVGLVDECVSGSGGLAVVIGDAGLGKTRLLDELETAAGWRGAQVTRAGADERDRLSPYGPVVDALQQAVTPSRRQVLNDLVDRVWLHQLDAVMTPADPATEGITVEVAALLRQVLAGLARVAPQVWLLDDLHWSPDWTWDLLDELLPAVADLPVLVVATVRREGLASSPPARAAVSRWDAAGVPLVPLEPLADADVATLARSLLDRSDADTGVAVDDVVEAAGGNPLVAIAMCGLTAAPHSGAVSIAEVVGRQLAAMAVDDVAALETASVLGNRFDYGLWREVAADPGLADRVATLERTGLIVPAGRGYRFSNGAVRAAIATRLPARRTRAMHHRALDSLARREPHRLVELLAHAEGAGLPAEITRYALETGVNALGASNFRLAAEHFRRALEVASDDDARRVALGGLARALHVLAERDEEDVVLTQLEAISAAGEDAHRRAAVARQRSRWQLATSRFIDALDTVGRALALLDESSDDVELRASFLIDRAAALRALGRNDEAAAAAEAARRAFSAAGAALGEATASDVLGGIAWARSDYTSAIALHGEAAERFAELGAPSHRARSLNNLGSALWGRGDYRAAGEAHEVALELCRALGDRLSEGDNLDNLGGVAFMLGELSTAIVRYREALAIRLDIDDPWGISISLSNLGDTYRALGEPERAIDQYLRSLEVNERAGVVRNDLTTRQGHAMALLDLDRPDEALCVLETVAAGHAAVDDHANHQETLTGVARARLALGDRPGALAAADELIARQRSDDRPELRQIVHLTVAAVHDAAGIDEAAWDHLGRAVAAMEQALAGHSPGDRQRIIDSLPHHRNTVAAVAAAATTVEVTLAAHAGARRGGAAGDRVRVTWTLRCPGDRELASTEGRRAVLARLLAEAASQGGVPTDDDLAAALGVSRRTVLRDRAALRGGAGPPTPVTV